MTPAVPITTLVLRRVVCQGPTLIRLAHMDGPSKEKSARSRASCPVQDLSRSQNCCAPELVKKEKTPKQSRTRARILPSDEVDPRT